MATPRVTALELLAAMERERALLRCGCEAVDRLLRGGLRAGVLTEICGEASAGKTQLSLQLLLQCRLPVALGGLGSSACYVSTEGVAAVKRLHDLAQSYAARYGALTRKRKRGEGGEAAADLLDGIFVQQVYTANELVDMLQTRLPQLLEEKQTKLVVIDSIAAVFRLESTASVKEASERSRAMFHLANCMRILSAQYGVIFVTTNQVTGDFRAQEGGGGEGGGAFKPALGLSWSSCVNQRLMIRRGKEAARRRLEVVFSPYLAPGHASFEITADGITDC